MKTLIVLALLAVSCIVCAETDPKENYKIATEALATLSKLVNEQNYQAMGFKSIEEVTAATLGQPFSTYMVRLDDLGAYQSGQDPDRIVKPLDRTVYPVIASGQVRSSIFVEKERTGWKATRFGSSRFVQVLAKTRKQLAEKTGLPEQTFFLVQIPALSAEFVGHRTAGELMLTSLFDNPNLGLVAGRTLPAADLLATLVSPSKHYIWPKPVPTPHDRLAPAKS